MKETIMSLIGAATFLTMLCLPFFIHYPMNDNYLQLYPVSLGIGVVAVVACIFSFVKGNGFRFCLSDYFFLALVAYYIIRYDYSLQLANWKVAFALLSVPLWFGSRIILSHRCVSRQWILGSMVAVGCLVAVWGLLQLYGYLPSNHNLFAITGPFYNPGPYSGYIAIIFCIALGCWLQSKGFVRYVWFAAIALMGCILPAGMSRSAWVGIFVGGLWMVALHFRWHKRLKSFFKQYPYKGISAAVVLGISLCIGSYLVFQMKSDSAYGRLFIWKNTCTAISDALLFGHGPGSFPMVYGKAQAEYFAKGDYTETEERVAGSPEYAFNEILQSWIEGGVILVILIGMILFTTIRNNFHVQKTPIVGGLIALFVFSLTSYPSHILPFGTITLLMLTGLITIRKEEKRTRVDSLYLCRTFMVLGLGLVIFIMHTSKHHAERWKYIELLHSTHSYKEASVGYKRLYEYFKHNPSFVFNYAKSLAAQEEYEASNLVLDRFNLISCNSIGLNLQGNNFEKLEKYEKAEACFIKSIDILPCRMYPHYLLAKLYREPAFKNEEKFLEQAYFIKDMVPKVRSRATDEMKDEINQLLTNKNKHK